MTDSKAHRELYPAQYTHSLCGKTVRHGELTFVVERVVASNFGALAIPVGGGKTAYAVGQCEVIDRCKAKVSSAKRRYEIISALPSGKGRSVRTGEGRYNYLGASWRTQGGYRGEDSVKRTVKKLAAMGFESTGSIPGGSPDGSSSNFTTSYVDEDENVVTIRTHYGSTAFENRFSVDVAFASKEDKEEVAA